MTQVLFDLKETSPNGDVPIDAQINCYPVARRKDGTVLVTRRGFTVRTGFKPTIVELHRTHLDGAWLITISSHNNDIVHGFYAVPAPNMVDGKEIPVPFNDLLMVDPDTLEPSEEPDPIWWAMARSTVTGGSVDTAGDLILTHYDGKTTNAGRVKGDRGERGLRGLQGEQGLQGDKGDKGDKGDTGATGVQGAQGERGEQGEPGLDGADGVDGEDGAPGQSVTVAGRVPTAAELPTTAADGAGYITENDGHLHVFVGGAFIDVGQIKGDQGDKGDQGMPGVPGAKGEGVNHEYSSAASPIRHFGDKPSSYPIGITLGIYFALNGSWPLFGNSTGFVFVRTERQKDFPASARQTITRYQGDNKPLIRVALNNDTWSVPQEQATTAPATTTTNGLMSAADKVKLDSSPFVNIDDYGAKHDGSDARTAIVAANAVALSTGKTLVGSGVYTIKSKTIITADCDFSAAQFDCDLTGVAIEVTSVRRKHLFGDIINTRKTAGGWSSVAGSKGLVIRNCNTSTIGYQFIRNFEHGLTVYGDSGGSAYNTFHCGALWHNKVNLVLETTTNTGTGYSNQNTFIGGRFSHETNDGTPNMPGVKHVWFRGGISPDDGGRTNNNLFLNSSFEGVMPEYTVDFDRASVNQMLNCRYEFGNAIIFREFARDNNLYGGFGLAEITKDVVNQGTRNRWTSTTEDATYSVFERKWANTSSHTHPWYVADWSNRSIALGTGINPPMKIQAITSSAMTVDASWHPAEGDTYDLGTNVRPWRNAIVNQVHALNYFVVPIRTNHPSTPQPNGVSIYAIDGATKRVVAQFPDGTLKDL